MDIQKSIVAILNHKKKIIGTGFLARENLILTCAHVVEQVSAGLYDMVTVRFASDGQEIVARVEWYSPSYEQDVAVLHVASFPQDVGVPLPLGNAAGSTGNDFYAYGYASVNNVQGIGARGKIVDIVENGRFVQLTSQEPDRGMSGAPVLDEARGLVIGMVTKGKNQSGIDQSQRNLNTTFATSFETICEACPELESSEICPYLGLNSFTDQKAQFFFGREVLTDKLLHTLRGGCRFLAIFGPSGSGKSSVVQAGLMPALRKGQIPGSQNWTQITIRPGDNPFEQIKAAGLTTEYLKSRPDLEQTVLFIDQFEELFTLCPDDIRARFVNDIFHTLENSQLILIISMRDDFYSVFNAKAAQLSESQYLKIENVPGTLKDADLIAMIEDPAKKVGIKLQDGLTALILKDLKRNGKTPSFVLPLLEFALTQLWTNRQDNLITHKGYESIGGVAGSLAFWADSAYTKLSKTDQALAQSLLTSLIHLGDETQDFPDTRKRRTLAEFDAPSLHIIKYFTDRRLLTTTGKTVEFVHDSIVREWGLLQSWIKNDRENIQIKADIRDSANLWRVHTTNDKAKSLVYHYGDRLKLAIKVSKLPNYQLSLIEKEYLDCCITVERKTKRVTIFGRTITIIGILLVSTILGVLTFLVLQKPASITTTVVITLTPVPTLTPTQTIIPGAARVDELHGDGGNVKLEQKLTPDVTMIASSNGVKVVVGEQSNTGNNTAGVMFWFGRSTGSVNFDFKHMMPALGSGALYIQPGSNRAEVHFVQEPDIMASVEGSRMIVEWVGDDIMVYCFEGKCRLDPGTGLDELKIEPGTKRLYRTISKQAEDPIIMSYDEQWAWNEKCYLCMFDIIATPTPTPTPINPVFTPSPAYNTASSTP